MSAIVGLYYDTDILEMTSLATPIQILNTTHIPSIFHHFRKLSEQDRTLRFRNYSSDEALKSYLDSINFLEDTILGIWKGDSVLVAVAHLSFYQDYKVADISLTVDAEYRRLGYGRALLDRAKQITESVACRQLKISSSLKNPSMISLAIKCGFCGKTCEHDEWEGSLTFIA